jgi:hypothetical protein
MCAVNALDVFPLTIANDSHARRSRPYATFNIRAHNFRIRTLLIPVPLAVRARSTHARASSSHHCKMFSVGSFPAFPSRVLFFRSVRNIRARHNNGCFGKRVPSTIINRFRARKYIRYYVCLGILFYFFFRIISLCL